MPEPAATTVLAIRLLAGEATTVSLVGALRGDGVESLLLKGASVERWLYRPDEWRLSSDIDLLVEPRCLAAAERGLKRLGFVNRYDGVSPSWAEEHADSWRSNAWPLPVDLHRSIWGIRAPVALVWQRLWADREPLMIGGTQVWMLDAAGRLLTLALHAAHHGETASRPLADLRRATEQVERGVWSEAVGLASDLGALEGFAAGLGLLLEGAALRDDLGLQPADPAVVRVTAEIWGAPPTAEGFMRLAESPGLRGKAGLLRHELVPSKEFMRSRSSRSALARRGRRGLLAAYVARLAELLVETPAGVRGAVRLRSRRRTRSSSRDLSE